MMTKCPQCGSSEIVPDLIVFTEETVSGHRPAYVKLVEPGKRSPKEVKAGFRAAICGSCGHTQLYTKYPKEILEAHKKGYVSDS